jgi:hypothetical protein
MRKKGFSQAQDYYQHGNQWVRLNPNGPNAGASGSFNRNGWTFVAASEVPGIYNPANMPAMSANDAASENNSTRPGYLFGEFVSGLGETNRFFGPQSVMVNEMQSSPALSQDRSNFCATACSTSGSSFSREGGENLFGLSGIRFVDQNLLGQNGTDSHTAAVAQGNETRAFVGSYQINISEVNPSNRLTNFTIKNSTGAYSFFYHLVSDRPQNSSGGRPALGTINQTMMWSEVNPCGCKR